MTELLNRPATRTRATSDEAAPPRSPLLAGALGALWALLAGLVCVALPVLLVWTADGRSGSDAAAALQTAGQVWLVAHAVSLDVPGGDLGLTPLGLALVPLLMLARAGGHCARVCAVRTVREAWVVSLALAAPYAVAAAAVTALARTPQVTPAPVQALFGGLLLGLLGAGFGAVRAAGLGRSVWRALPREVAAVLAGAGAALLALLGCGALLVAAALALHAGKAADLAAATGAGAVGSVALLLLGLAALPNAVVWGACWLAGPGFAVGVGTAVSPLEHHLGAVPAFPLFAALPGGPAPMWLTVAALGVPLLAGATSGLVLVRRLVVRPGWRAAAAGAVTGLPAGLALGLLAALSGGPLGDGRLAAVGPSPWRCGLAFAAEVAVGAALAASLGARRQHQPVRP